MPSGFITNRQYIKYDNYNPERAVGEILKFILIKIHGKECAMDRMVNMLSKLESVRECIALVPVLVYEKERMPKQTRRIKDAIESNPYVRDAVGNEVIHYLFHEPKESRQLVGLTPMTLAASGARRPEQGAGEIQQEDIVGIINNPA